MSELYEKATPRPWFLGAGGGSVRGIYEDDFYGESIRRVVAQSDAPKAIRDADFALIIHAVNNIERLERERDELVEALRDALSWIECECQPEAEWVAEGHNWNMSEEDRGKGKALLGKMRALLSRITPETGEGE